MMESMDTLALPWSPRWSLQPGLVASEYAHWNPDQADRVTSADWDMDSGSLFYRDGYGWTGKIDSGEPDRLSRRTTNSAVFRLTTSRADFENVRVSFDLYLDHLTQTSETPAVAWDGVHIFLRYQSEYDLCYASVARRDGRVVVKRKVPGGPSNDGTYTEIGDEKPGFPLKRKTWTPVAATVKTTRRGVEFAIERGGRVIYTAVDPDGLVLPGAVGIRADNAEIRFRNFRVDAA
jgi:hypothetical protein